jgi:DNA polymerase III alpha subunit
MTRGSAGSSLVCYLLGITDIDPIDWNIPVARFLNPLRDDLPDVDIDFPHHKQDEVMQRIFAKWPGKTARISNFVMFKEKSARREVAKRLGAVGRLPRNFTYKSLGLDEKEAKRLERKLIGKKKCISKHCGGILVFQNH